MVREPPAEVTGILPRPFASLFPDAPKRVTLRAGTVEELLLALDQRWPGMRDRLRDTSPAVRKHINIFVDGRRATLQTQLPPGQPVYILTAMSGG